MKKFKILLWIATTFVFSGSEAQEWSCSPSDSDFNHRSLSYHDRDLNETKVSLDRDNSVMIFPVPTRSLNCSGEVTAVEFYYIGFADEVRLGTAHQVFSLLILEQKNFTFEIKDVIDVNTTASSKSCRNQSVTSSSILFCHDGMQLQENDRFSLPESNFAYGIVPLSSTVKLIQYRDDSILESQIQQFSLPISALGTAAVGNSITVSESNTTLEAFTLLQFVITSTADGTTNSAIPNLAIYIGTAVGGSGVVILMLLATAIACMANANRRGVGKTSDASEMAQCLHISHNTNIIAQQTKEDLHHNSFEAVCAFPRLETDAHTSVAFSTALTTDSAEVEDANIYDHLRPARDIAAPVPTLSMHPDIVTGTPDLNTKHGRKDGHGEIGSGEQLYINREFCCSRDDHAERSAFKNPTFSFKLQSLNHDENFSQEQLLAPIHPANQACSAFTKDEDDYVDPTKYENLSDEVTVLHNQAYGVTANTIPKLEAGPNFNDETVVAIPNPAYGVTGTNKGETNNYGCVSAKSEGYSSDTNAGSMINHAWRDFSPKIDDSIYVNTISEVQGTHLDHVETSPNLAYGIVTENRTDDYDYDDIITQKRHSQVLEQHLASHDHTSSHVTVSPNEAYGVLRTEEKDGNDYDDILPEASSNNTEHVATIPNEAYNITTT